VTKSKPDLVCISHLWWDWVWQRPQHLVSRLARQYRVFWTEEPHIEIGSPSENFELREVLPDLCVGQLILRSDADTFWARLADKFERIGGDLSKVAKDTHETSLLFDSPYQQRLEQEVREYVAARRQGPLVLWLYTPVVVKFIDILKPDLVVYDVMDELTAFKFAPPQLRQQEQELFERADLIFTGGPSLYEARKDRHRDVHLFPSGVEQQHFAQALREDLPLPANIQDISGPVIGFYGVIDERVDLELLRGAAQLRPDWHWVMIGPILKIEEGALPELPNIHYLGKQDYKDLPAYLKAFDVAMMPFALNESTRFISPTKTLEYMAAHKPIVSTPVHDVISLYGSVVRIAETAQQFVDKIETALNEAQPEREERINKENELLRQYEWDHIAEQMHLLIQDRLQRTLAKQESNR
jgi:UDP-galactopyranose mutase